MPTGDALLAQIDRLPILPNSLALWGLGQMGLIIKGPDAVIYIDPCLSYIVKERPYPPPIEPEDVKNVDYLLCSHEHADHLDPLTVVPLLHSAPDAKVITTGWCTGQLIELGITQNRILTPEALTPYEVPNTSLRVTPIPAAHYEKEYDEQKGYRWLGFLLEWNGVTVYFAGDTVLFEGYIDMLKGLPKADIAMLPVNGRDYFRDTVENYIGNLMPKEAGRLAMEMEWDLVITGHNDMLPRNTIPMGEVTQGFADECPRQAHKILQAGELLYYVK